ncbi:hypothetical protein DFH09DRAFT_1335192 [Mycena vulgaris]|nr:hypothetical protein DFH09DRAFT_1335192 [Mycena vulgaris]
MSSPQRVSTRSHPCSPTTTSTCCTLPSPNPATAVRTSGSPGANAPPPVPPSPPSSSAPRTCSSASPGPSGGFGGGGELGVVGAAASRAQCQSHSARRAQQTACTPGNVTSSLFSTILSPRPPPPPFVPAAAPPPPPPVPPTRARRPHSAPRALPILPHAAPPLHGVGHLGLYTSHQRARRARRAMVLLAQYDGAEARRGRGATPRIEPGRHAYVKSWRKRREGDAHTGLGAAAEEYSHRPRGRCGVAAQGRLPAALAIALALPVSLTPPPATVRPVTYFSLPERPATAAALFDSLPSGASGLAASYATTRVRRAR